MKAQKNLKTIIRISAIAIVILGMIILCVLWYGIDLKLNEYQSIPAVYDLPELHKTRVIDTQEDEMAIEREFGISIKDGTDYEHYSLILSKGYRINEFTMFVFDHPHTCVRGDEKCNQIALCEPELGEQSENTIFIYIVQQKNIMSWDEAELNFL